MHNWDDLRYFLEVVRAGSFAGAAQALGVNHSTISRRVAALEARHGVHLLERTQQGYELSEAGAAIIESLEAMDAAQMQASRVLLGQDARLAGPLNVTLPHEVFDFLLVEPLARFSREYPDIELSLQVSRGLRNLANREADLAVRISPAPPDYLVGRRVVQIQHGFYARRDRLAEMLAAEHTPIILWTVDSTMPEWALDHFHKPRVVLKIDDLFAMYRAVAAGIGIARMPCFMADVLGEPTVGRLPIDLPRSDWGLWVLHHPDLRNTARIQRLKAVLTTELEQRQPLFHGETSAYLEMP